jgi:hypothetical protein
MQLSLYRYLNWITDICLWNPSAKWTETWSFSSFGQTVSEEKNLKNQPIRNKSRLWRPYLLTDRDEISNLYRGPSIDASYQVSVSCLNIDICIQNAVISIQISELNYRYMPLKPLSQMNWNLVGNIYGSWPCLLTDRDEMSNLYRGPSIDASYKVSVHLAKRFQRRRFFKNQPIRNTARGDSCFWLADI